MKHLLNYLKDPRILFFVVDTAPTLADVIEARTLGRNCSFRAGSLDAAGGGAEPCDGVAGPAIPPAYAKFPRALDVIKAHNDAVDRAFAEEQQKLIQAADADELAREQATQRATAEREATANKLLEAGAKLMAQAPAQTIARPAAPVGESAKAAAVPAPNATPAAPAQAPVGTPPAWTPPDLTPAQLAAAGAAWKPQA